MSPSQRFRRAEPVVLIAVGGFAGASLRHLVGSVAPGLVGTLAVNATGSFLLGAILYRAIYAGSVGRRTRLVVTTGFLASFTTFSTFALETVLVPELAIANVAATYALGFAGVLVGRETAVRLTGGSG